GSRVGALQEEGNRGTVQDKAFEAPASVGRQERKEGHSRSPRRARCERNPAVRQLILQLAFIGNAGEPNRKENRRSRGDEPSGKRCTSLAQRLPMSGALRGAVTSSRHVERRVPSLRRMAVGRAS